MFYMEWSTILLFFITLICNILLFFFYIIVACIRVFHCFELKNMIFDIHKIYIKLFIYYMYIEAGRGAAARGVTAKPTGCGFDPHSRR